jgi:ribosome-binding protein aMBF1 (putative translation factor)
VVAPLTLALPLLLESAGRAAGIATEVVSSFGAAEYMRAREPSKELGYGDFDEVAVCSDGLVEVMFGNGDIVRFDPARLGVTGEYTVYIAKTGRAVSIRTQDGWREIDAMVVRANADPAFAQQLRERDRECARRIGRRLRALRENRGISRNAVAGKVGMSSRQLGKLERGDAGIWLPTISSVLRALGADATDLEGITSETLPPGADRGRNDS